MFIVHLSSRAGKIIRGQKLLIVCLSGRVWKFKREAKNLLIVYLSGMAGKFKREAKKVNCLSNMTGKFKRGKKLEKGFVSIIIKCFLF